MLENGERFKIFVLVLYDLHENLVQCFFSFEIVVFKLF